MSRLKLLIFLIFVATFVPLAETDSKSLDLTKKITAGSKEFKNFVDGLEKVITDERFLGSIKKLSGFLGVAGGFVSFVLAFLPSQESAELKFMKQQFAEVNMKLDRITSEFDDVKNLITLESQRATYVDSATRILFAYKQLTTDYMSELSALSCFTKKECLRERLKISGRYVKTFNIKEDMYKILKGTAESISVFGDPLLELVGKTCDIQKVLQFANGVIKLAFKGQQVILAHEKLTGSNVSISFAMKEWSEMVYNVRQKADDVRYNCYMNIHKYMNTDIEDSKYQTGFEDNKDAAVAMKNDLKRKYPWVIWTVLSYGAYDGKNHWGGYIFQNMPDKGRRRVLRVIPSDNGTYSLQKNQFSSWLENFKQNDFFDGYPNAHRIYDKLLSQMKRDGIKNKISTLVVLSKYDNEQVASDRDDVYFDESLVFRFRFVGSYNISNYINESVRIWATFNSDEEIAGVTCTRTCSNNGVGMTIPFTSKTYCMCSNYYYGENCEKYDDIKLAADIDEMLAVTSRIPKLSDVYFELEDLRDYIGVSLHDTQHSIYSLGKIMQTKFDQLNDRLTTEFKWHNLVTIYSDSIRKLDFYLYEFHSLNPLNPNYQERKEYLAKIVSKPDAIEQWVRDLNFIIVGRNQILLEHKPLIFILIDRHKAQACNEKYKEALDTAWRQIVLLQNQAYVMWANTLAILHESSAHVTSKYKQLVLKQTEFMENATCHITILNSENVNCSGGFYMYPGMEFTNQCSASYEVQGNSSITCANPSICRSCNYVYPYDRPFEKECKNNFYGRGCQNRDCVMTCFSYGRCQFCHNGFGLQRGERHVMTPKQGWGDECLGPFANYRECKC